MLKFVIGVALIAFTTVCGYLLSRKYRERKLFFRQFREFNDRFISEISYFKRPIEDFVAAYAYQGEFDNVLQRFFLGLKDDSSAENGLDLSDQTFLSDAEKQLVFDYFLMFGKGDSLSQKNYFSAVKERLSKLEANADAEAKRYGDLYIKLGFLCGLLLLILLV